MRKRSHYENFVSVMAVHLTIGEENVAMQTRAASDLPWQEDTSEPARSSHLGQSRARLENGSVIG
jgi:hypothetical protein